MTAAVRQIVPEADPKQILLDFEIAAMNQFHNSYPNTEIKGCFFHLSQCVYRKARELGMKAAMESSQELATLILCLPALSLVPVDSVEESFDILADAMSCCHTLNMRIFVEEEDEMQEQDDLIFD